MDDTKKKPADLQIPKRSTLEDLYKSGERVEISDNQGQTEVVWVAKLLAPELKIAMTKGSRERAKVRALKDVGDDNEERSTFRSEAEMDGMVFTRESCIAFLQGTVEGKSRLSHEAEIGAEERWSKDNYLEGLITAWNDGLHDRWQIDNEDDEAKAVYDKLAEFTALVDEAVDIDKQHYAREHLEDSDEELVKAVIDTMIDYQAEDAWFGEYRRWCAFFATRKIDNHHERYFDSRESIDRCDPRAIRQILDALDKLNVETLEGKD